MISRRSFFTGSAALLAAPSIVRVSSLMPLSVPKLIVPAPLMVSMERSGFYTLFPGRVAWSVPGDPRAWLTEAESWSLDALPGRNQG